MGKILFYKSLSGLGLDKDKAESMKAFKYVLNRVLYFCIVQLGPRPKSTV